MLNERYGLVHISAGDLLRARRNLMPELAEFLDNGRLVPDEVVCAVISERLAQSDCARFGVLLDGFPRTLKQAEVLQSMGVQCDRFLLLDVPDGVVEERISGRRYDPVSGKIYHVTFKPPESDEIKDRLLQRNDDTLEKIRNRLNLYRTNITSLLEFYQAVRSDVRLGDGSGVGSMRMWGGMQNESDASLWVLSPAASPEIVFDRVRMLLESDYW
jgi:adenylate kinase